MNFSSELYACMELDRRTECVPTVYESHEQIHDLGDRRRTVILGKLIGCVLMNYYNNNRNMSHGHIYTATAGV